MFDRFKDFIRTKYLKAGVVGAVLSLLCLGLLGLMYGASDFHFSHAKVFSDEQRSDPRIWKVLHSAVINWIILNFQLFYLDYGFNWLLGGALVGMGSFWIWCYFSDLRKPDPWKNLDGKDD